MLILRARLFRPVVLLLTYLLVVVGLLAGPVGDAHAEAPEPEDTSSDAVAPVTREVSWQVRGGGDAVPETAWLLTDADGSARTVVDNAAAGGSAWLGDVDATDGTFVVADLPIGAYTMTAAEVGDDFAIPAPTRFRVEEGTGTQALDPITLDPITLDPITLDPIAADPETESPDTESTETESTETGSTETESGTAEPEAPKSAAPKSAAPKSAAPKSAAPKSATAKSVPTPQPAAQPPLPQTCGLDIAIVLDLSNSLSDDDVAGSKSAAKGFVNALAGTPSSVGLYTFASHANPNNSLGIISVATEAGATTVRNSIDAVQRVASGVGGTNWDKGFAQVPTGTYDLIVFVTDGNPTAYGTPGTGSNSDFGTGTQPIDINSGITSANVHKQAGTFVIGLGVGMSTTRTSSTSPGAGRTPTTT